MKCSIGMATAGLPAVGDSNTSNDWASDVDECARKTKWLGNLPLGGVPRFGPKPRRTMSWSGGVYPPHRNLHGSASCSSSWPKLPLTGSFLSLDVSLVRSRFQSPGAPYGADVLRRAGDVRTWRFQNIHNPAAKNGIISKGLLQQKRGRMLFWSLRPFLVTASGYDRWQETGAAN